MSSSKPVVAIDIDEVLFPMAELFLKFHNDNHGTDLSVSDMHSYYVEEITGDSEEVMLGRIEAFVNSPEFRGIRPLKKAVEATRELSEAFELVLVTARDHFYRAHTELFIEEYFGGVFSSLSYTHTPEQPFVRAHKYELCEKLSAVALVDDSLKNVSECAEHGMRGVVFGEYPWNKADKLPAGVTRCRDWAAVLEYFDGVR